MNQEILEALAALRDLAAYHLWWEIKRLIQKMEELAHDKQNTDNKTPPSDTRT